MTATIAPQTKTADAVFLLVPALKRWAKRPQHPDAFLGFVHGFMGWAGDPPPGLIAAEWHRGYAAGQKAASRAASI